MKKLSLLAGILLAAYCCTTGQAIKIPFDQDKWEAFRATMKPETYMGKEGILLDSGLIYTKNVNLTDGIIEVDMNFPQERYFPGVEFRMQDINNYESFYVRPHQSGNPDATQYTPVFNGQAGWQLYHGPGYSSAITFSFNTWHHIKIDIHGLQAEIYMDDMQTPLIKVMELKRAWKGGNIGLNAGGALVHFANLQYTPKEGPAPVALPIPANGTGGMITQWQISNIVSSNLFEKKYQLTPELKRQFTFTTQRSEPSGIINLSRWGR